jgi:hypothetical protein
VGGRENISAYAGFVGGTFNKGYGLYSDIQGAHNISYGDAGHVEGYGNIAGLPGTSEMGAHAEGGGGVGARNTTSTSVLWSATKNY